MSLPDDDSCPVCGDNCGNLAPFDECNQQTSFEQEVDEFEQEVDQLNELPSPSGPSHPLLPSLPSPPPLPKEPFK